MSLTRGDGAQNEASSSDSHPPLRNITSLPAGKSEPASKESISNAPNPILKQAQNGLSDPFVAAFIAGGMAGAISRTIVSPLERLKILLQIQSVGRTEYKLSIWKALVKIGREEGWRGFMRGNGTNCIRIIPYSAVQFGSYSLKGVLLAEPTPGADLNAIQRLLCGGMAGITSVTITYPLDIVRTRLSIQSASFAELRTEQQRQLPGMFQTMRLMYRNEGGFLALYRGIIPTVAGVAPYVSFFSGLKKFPSPYILTNLAIKVGLNFMTYESVRKYLTPDGELNPSPYRKLLAGAISGAVAQTCTYPFDVLRRRFQVNTMSGLGYQYTSVWGAVKMIVSQEGVRGLYKGIVPNLLKVAPSMASSWVSFELTRDFLIGLSESD
ncbi:hypothetical protein FQN55_000449 [Onygenales sp. PD_40]|nr:hypothetical protein FQN55_000449 [Onygenales sp. PD_40]